MDRLIRKVELKDFFAIKKIEKDCFDEPWDDVSLSFELYFSKDSYYYVYLLEETIVGFFGLRDIDGIYNITTLCVTKAYRKQGIARAMLDYIFNNFKDKAFVLEVAINNYNAIDLYKKYDFQITKTLKNYYKHNDAYYMEAKNDYFRDRN